MQSSHFARLAPPSQDSPAVAVRRGLRTTIFEFRPAGGVGLAGAAREAAVFRPPFRLSMANIFDVLLPILLSLIFKHIFVHQSFGRKFGSLLGKWIEFLGGNAESKIDLV